MVQRRVRLSPSVTHVGGKVSPNWASRSGLKATGDTGGDKRKVERSECEGAEDKSLRRQVCRRKKKRREELFQQYAFASSQVNIEM